MGIRHPASHTRVVDKAWMHIFIRLFFTIEALAWKLILATGHSTKIMPPLSLLLAQKLLVVGTRNGESHAFI